MSKEPPGIEVTILGKQFRVACSEEQQKDLLKAVQFVGEGVLPQPGDVRFVVQPGGTRNTPGPFGTLAAPYIRPSSARARSTKRRS